MGYFFYKERLFERLLDALEKKFSNISAVCIISLILISLLSTVNYKILGLKSGIIYTPIYIFCIAMLRRNVIERRWFSKIYELLAKHSLNIWILHGLFFSGITREVFQPIAFLPGNLFLVVIWEILICLLISLLISPIQDLMVKMMVQVK